MDFWRALDILGKRKWLIIACVLACTLLTYGATRMIGSKWTASVRFLSTASQAPNPTTIENRGPEGAMARLQAEIFLQVVKSRPVMERALKKLDARQLPAGLVENLKFEATSQKLYTLEVSLPNMDQAEKWANAVGESFVEQYRELSSEQARQLVAQTEREARARQFEKSQALKRMDEYRNSRGIYTDLGGKADPLITQLSQAESNYNEAQQKIGELNSSLAVQTRELGNLPDQVPYDVGTDETPIIKSLLQEQATYLTKLQTLKARYTDDHIEVKQVKFVLDQLTTSIAEQRKGIGRSGGTRSNPAKDQLRLAIAQTRQELEAANGRLGAISASRDRVRSQLEQLKGVDTRLQVLAGEVADKNEAFKQVNARVQAALQALDASQSQNPLVIMDRVNPFNPPINMTAGRTKKLLALAFLCSLIGSCALVLGLDIIDRRLRTVEQAELILPAPVISAIPLPMGGVTNATLARAAELHPLSPHSEAYRFLAVHLLDPSNRDTRSLMVLSAKADQGSTNTVTNLGITLAQAGQRVIIVDANVRSPHLHSVFGTANEQGFSTLVRRPDAASFERAIKATSVPNLRIITSGPTPDNPWELFRSQNLREVAGRLKDLADFIIYDTPSALAFTDVMNLTSVVDGAFLCVRALEAPSGGEQRIVEMLEKANVKILGSVLNDVPATVLSSYESYQHYYPGSGGVGQNGNGVHDPDVKALNGNGTGRPAPRSGYVVPGDDLRGA